MMKRLFLLLIATFCMAASHAQRADNYRPDNPNVAFTKSNLPIIVMSTGTKQILRNADINADMTIIDNADGTNYRTTGAQTPVYNGSILLRYGGNEWFAQADKKAYHIATTDGKEYELLAPFADRSLIRTALAFSLARPYSTFVPEAKLCEVVIDNTYYGVYLLVSSPANTISKENMAQVLRNVGGKTPVGASFIASWASQLGSNGIANTTHLESAADYILNSEMAHNADAYRLENYLYKGSDGKMMFVASTADCGFGNNYAMEGFRTDTWVHAENTILKALDEPMLVPEYWNTIINSEGFNSLLASRWKTLRKGQYSDSRIIAIVDSLTHLVTAEGAAERNHEAWPRWGKTLFPNYTVANSYSDEISSLKQWIADRTAWIDANISTASTNPQEPNTPQKPQTETVTEYTPITIASGFNTDCIVESLATAHRDKTQHPALDGHGSAFVTQQVAAGTLPNNGLLMGENGERYQLSDFSGNNCLYLAQSGSQGTLVFSEPVITQQIGILAVGTNKDTVDPSFSVTVNYVSGNSATTTFSISDWGGTDTQGDYLFTYNKRYRADAGSNPESCSVSLSEKKMSVDMSRAVKSLTIRSTSASGQWGYGMVGVFAVSGITTVTTGIADMSAPTQKVIMAIYSTSGRKLHRLEKGVNIVRYTDGTSRKVFVK